MSATRPKRILCACEGHGETTALPKLVARVLYQYLAVPSSQWSVVREAMRSSRSKLVAEASPSPGRAFGRAEFERLVRVAKTQELEPDALLIVCDADDDCPAAWGASIAAAKPFAIPVYGVMAKREFESWVLWSYPDDDRRRARAIDPETAPRDAKTALARLIPAYAAATGQYAAAAAIDVALVRARSDSFDKFVRTIAATSGATLPER